MRLVSAHPALAHAGIEHIGIGGSDGEGTNQAELDGFAGAPLDGVVVGKNLVVIANYAPLFTFENFVGNEQAFAGLQLGDQFIPTEDLLA